MHSAAIKKIQRLVMKIFTLSLLPNSTGKLTRLIYFKSPDALNHEKKNFYNYTENSLAGVDLMGQHLLPKMRKFMSAYWPCTGCWIYRLKGNISINYQAKLILNTSLYSKSNQDCDHKWIKGLSYWQHLKRHEICEFELSA